MKSDRDKVSDLEATWDRLAQVSRVRQAPGVGKPNPYEASFTEAGPSNDDQNLLTSFMLLTSAGFDQPLGVMMAKEAEHLIPFTLNKLHLAREAARKTNNDTALRMKEEFRGQTVMAYSWGFTMSRTKKLFVPDREIIPHLMQIAATTPGSEERRRICASAQNKLESTLGTILQAIKSAENKGETNLRLFYNGSIMMLYALANVHYGYSAAPPPENNDTA